MADEDADFDCSAPDEELHRFVNDLERPVGMYLCGRRIHVYGRRIYAVMAAWDAPQMLADASPAVRDFAQIWQAAEKVVYSTSLTTRPTARTRIEVAFDPGAVERMKPSPSAT